MARDEIMVRLKHTWAALMCGAAVLSFLICPTTATAAGRPCSRSPGDPYVNYFDGRQSAHSSTVRGVRARIEYNNPELCGLDDANDGFSIAWSMVVAHSIDPNVTNLSYAQSGYGDFGGSTPGYEAGIHVFSQYTYLCHAYNACGSQPSFHTEFDAAPTGQQFYSSYKKSNGLIYMYAGSIYLDSTNYNPSGDWADQWGGQFYGETLDLQTDMPGIASNHAKFDYIQKYDSSQNPTFFAHLGSAHSATSRYKYSTTAPASGGLGLQIWTDPL